VQGRLNSLGYAAGSADGGSGPRSRAAIAEGQAVEGIAPTGFPSAAHLALLRQTSVMRTPQWLAAQPAPRAIRTTRTETRSWRPAGDRCAARTTDSKGQLRCECDRL
jgi:peptidoglycan hydrolase-like protein with peptidoglycan-binding domain